MTTITQLIEKLNNVATEASTKLNFNISVSSGSSGKTLARFNEGWDTISVRISHSIVEFFLKNNSLQDVYDSVLNGIVDVIYRFDTKTQAFANIDRESLFTKFGGKTYNIKLKNSTSKAQPIKRLKDKVNTITRWEVRNKNNDKVYSTYYSKPKFKVSENTYFPDNKAETLGNLILVKVN